MYLVHALGLPTKVTDDDNHAAQDRCRAGHGSPYLREQAGAEVARAAHHVGHDRGGAVRDPAGRAVRPGGTPGDDAGRARRAREGAAALDDPGHRRARGAQPGAPLAAPDRPAAGDPDRYRGRAGGRPACLAAQGRLAGPAAGRAEYRGAGRAPCRSADPGETQPVVVTGPPATGPVAGPVAGGQFASEVYRGCSVAPRRLRTRWTRSAVHGWPW